MVGKYASIGSRASAAFRQSRGWPHGDIRAASGARIRSGALFAAFALLFLALATGPVFGQGAEAISREWSVFNFGQSSTEVEAISREVSVFNFFQEPYQVEAISREMSVYNSTNYAPRIVTQPQSLTAVAGGPVTFSVGLSGTAPFSYQWRFNASNLPGATNATLLLTNVQPAQEGLYRVTITNPFGAILSKPATLTVVVLPSITRHPIGTNAPPGSTITLFVTASGSPQLHYQWRRNGSNLTGATGVTLVLSNLQQNQADNYDVVVNNLFGVAYSSVASVSVWTPLRLDWVAERTNAPPRFRLSWTADEDFVLQVSTNLTDWLPLATNAAPGRVFEFIDPDTSLHQQRFFRARNWP